MATANSLLVPISVEAFVANGAMSAVQILDMEMDYQSLSLSLESPAPAPFSGQVLNVGAGFPTGIRVFWELPKALRTGRHPPALAAATLAGDTVSAIAVEFPSGGYTAPPTVTLSGGGGSGALATAALDANGQVSTITVTAGGSGYQSAPTVSLSAPQTPSFPLVPNRWLVVRFVAGGAAPNAAWVIESDYLPTGDAPPATNAFVSPYPETPFSGQAPLFRDNKELASLIQVALGRNLPLDSWPDGQESTCAPFLTAVGPGDPDFSSRFQNAQDVFGFFDDMTGIGDEVTISYGVIGWYQGGGDPVAANAVWAQASDTSGWTALPDAQQATSMAFQPFGWTVALPDGLPDSLPDASYYSGMTFGLLWQNETVPPRPNSNAEQAANQLCVAVGETQDAALAALLTNQLAKQGGLAPVATITVTDGGSLYDQDTTVVYVSAPPSPVTAQATVSMVDANGGIFAVAVSDGGGGYPVPPQILPPTGGNGYGAVLVPVMNGDKINEIQVITPGAGYAEEDAVIITAPPTAVQATAEPVITNGVVTAITLTNPGSFYPSAPTVSINGAGTGAQATAQLLSAEVDQQIIEAFQLGLLDEYERPDGTARVAEALHRSSFGHQRGGTLWTAVPEHHRRNAGRDLPPALGLALAQLNQAQAQYDTNSRVTSAMRGQLYMSWWKRISQDIGNLPNPEPVHFGWITDNLRHAVSLETAGSFAAETEAALTQLDSQKTALESARHSLETSLAAIGWRLKAAPDQGFWHGQDPSILVSGLQGPASLMAPAGGTLECRLSGTTIAGLAWNGFSVDAQSLGDAIPSFDNADLPPIVADLLTEAFFLCPSNASVIAGAEGFNMPAEQAALAAAIGTRSSAITWLAAGAVPPPAFAAALWSQAWTPIHLHWQMQFIPTLLHKNETTGEDPWQFDRADWVLSPQQGAFDYDWRGGSGTPGPTALGMPPLLGETALSGNTLRRFQNRLRAWLKAHSQTATTEEGILQTVENLLSQCLDLNILSQQLAGFNQGLLTVTPEIGLVPPPGPLRRLIGPYFGLAPDVQRPLLAVNGAPYFMPLPAGFFYVTGLRVIDRFGQFVDLRVANGNSLGAETDHPPLLPLYRSAALTPGPYNQLAQVISSADLNGGLDCLAQLRPRLPTPARLNLTLISAGTPPGAPSIATHLGLLANPVCGWLVSNRLDRAIAVYDAGGVALGEICLVTGDPGARLVWVPAPGSGTDLAPAAVGQATVIDGVVVAVPDVSGSGFAAPPQVTFVDSGQTGSGAEAITLLDGTSIAGVKIVNGGSSYSGQTDVLFYDLPIETPQAIANPYLQKLVCGLMAADKPAKAFEALLGCLERTGRRMDAETSRHDSSVPALFGHPIAVVRAELEFQFAGPAAYDQSWVSPYGIVPGASGDSAGVADLAFEVIVGNSGLSEDGVAGYYQGTDFARFYAVDPPEAPPEDGYILPIAAVTATADGERVWNVISLPVNPESWVETPDSNPLVAPASKSGSAAVTVLVDPRGSIGAYAALLPGVKATLPADYVEAALQQISLSVRVGPILTDADAIDIPRPTDLSGSWNWLQAGPPGSWQTCGLNPTDDKARLSGRPPVARDGWLIRQSHAKPRILDPDATAARSNAKPETSAS